MNEPAWAAVPFKADLAAAVRRQARRQTRATLRARLDAVLRTLAAALLSALLGLGAWQGYRWATGSAFFALREVRFSGLSHAVESDLLRRSGLVVGENLFHADLSRASQALEAHPWVISARLERRLPGLVQATVVEHRAAALVQLGGLYVVDEEGRLFKRAVPEDQLDLPLITGASREAWTARRPEVQLRLFAALHLLDAWRAAGLPIASLSEVRLDEDLGITLFAKDGEGVQEVRLGAAEFGLKLRRLAQIRGALARRGEHAARIELDNPARPDQAAATLAQQR